MFDPFSTYNGFLPLSDDFQDDDRETDALDPITRFAAWFTVGIAGTFLIRLLPALAPFYWILAVAGIAGLAIALHITRNVRLLALAAMLVAATLAGHWDGLAQAANQANQRIQEVLPR